MDKCAVLKYVYKYCVKYCVEEGAEMTELILYDLYNGLVCTVYIVLYAIKKIIINANKTPFQYKFTIIKWDNRSKIFKPGRGWST